MKILIVDDHALFREGLCHVLNGLDEQAVVFEAANCDRAIELATGNPDIDLVLLDLNMPGRDGFSTLESFTKSHPATPVVILSASNQRKDVQRALEAGAVGYIPKDTTSAVMLNALQLILSGGIYTPPDVALQHEDAPDRSFSDAPDLTQRQLQVLALLVQGASNKVIARQLDLAEATVKMHISAILNSLGVTNRTQAAMAAEKLGLCCP